MTESPTSELLMKIVNQINLLGSVPAADTEAEHVGEQELPFVQVEPGLQLQLLYVDLNTNTWVNRSRFAPGTSIAAHYHTGQVFAFTIQGRWFYEEYPHVVNEPGSFLYEPAHSVHTLTTPADQEGDTEVWFVLHGTNVNIDRNGTLLSLADGKLSLAYYRAYCDAHGLSYQKLVVKGE